MLALSLLASSALALDLDAFMSFPIASSLLSVTFNDIERAAWVTNEMGIPNIFVAEGTNVFQRTFYTGDEGLVLDALQFTKDASTLLYAQAPIDRSNPTHNIEPLGTQLISLSLLDKSVPRTLVSTLESKVFAATPDSKSVAIIKGGNSVYDVNIKTGNSTFLFKLPIGGIRELVWSPDGTTLAFISSRGDHAYVGLYSRGSTNLKYVHPSVDTDLQIVWSPSGKELAFYRTRVYLSDQFAQSEVLPVSVMVYSLSTGKVAEIYRDDVIGLPQDCGYGNRVLAWAGDGSGVIVPTEKDGWLHVLFVPLNAQLKPRDLTPGECENADWIVNGDWLYVSHNCDNINAQGVARVNINTGARQILLPGSLHHVAGVAEDGYALAPQRSRVFFLHATTNTSLLPNVVNLKGSLQSKEEEQETQELSRALTQHRASVQGRFNSSEFVTPTVTSFLALDKKYTVHMQVFKPASLKPDQRAPAVVFTHGGPRRQLFPAFHFAPFYAELYAQNQFLASKGFVVVSVNYRMGAGYGRKFRMCEQCGWRGAAEYTDVLGAQRWLAQQAFVDPSRIGIYGLSYGGLNTLQGLTRNPEAFAVGVASAPVVNWVSQLHFGGDYTFEYNPNFSDMAIRIGPPADLANPDWTGLVDRNVKLAWESSPMSRISNLSSPVLLIHGDLDRNVDFQETTGFIRAARRLGKDNLVFSMIYPDDNHGLAQYYKRRDVAQATVDFLSKYLLK